MNDEMEYPNTSPTRSKTTIEVIFDFPTAMQHVIQGKKVSKKEWDDPDTYVYLDGRLKIKLPNGIHELIVSDGDMLGTDWFIV